MLGLQWLTSNQPTELWANAMTLPLREQLIFLEASRVQQEKELPKKNDSKSQDQAYPHLCPWYWVLQHLYPIALSLWAIEKIKTRQKSQSGSVGTETIAETNEQKAIVAQREAKKVKRKRLDARREAETNEQKAIAAREEALQHVP